MVLQLSSVSKSLRLNHGWTRGNGIKTLWEFSSKEFIRVHPRPSVVHYGKAKCRSFNFHKFRNLTNLAGFYREDFLSVAGIGVKGTCARTISDAISISFKELFSFAFSAHSSLFTLWPRGRHCSRQ